MQNKSNINILLLTLRTFTTMKAIYVIDCLVRSNDTSAQEQMGIIYGDRTKSTADVVNTFGRCHIMWGNVLAETNYSIRIASL